MKSGNSIAAATVCSQCHLDHILAVSSASRAESMWNLDIGQSGQFHELVRKINRTTHQLNDSETHVKFLSEEQLQNQNSKFYQAISSTRKIMEQTLLVLHIRAFSSNIGTIHLSNHQEDKQCLLSTHHPPASSWTTPLRNRQQRAGHVQFQQGTTMHRITSSFISTSAGREPLYTRRDLHQSLQFADSEIAVHPDRACS